MDKLRGFQRKYLRSLAHNIKPVVLIGQKGMTESVISSVDESLNKHELIKIKFIEFKEKTKKKEISEIIEKKTLGEMVGMIGHIAIFYRQNADPEKRNIVLPKK
ncbi:MAG: YhbY family RNA-binding protein [Desulfobacterales bacterium]|nr:YhbY family RNA-binding protein [Desulfobacterales bacterium]